MWNNISRALIAAVVLNSSVDPAVARWQAWPNKNAFGGKKHGGWALQRGDPSFKSRSPENCAYKCDRRKGCWGAVWNKKRERCHLRERIGNTSSFKKEKNYITIRWVRRSDNDRPGWKRGNYSYDDDDDDDDDYYDDDDDNRDRNRKNRRRRRDDDDDDEDNDNTGYRNDRGLWDNGNNRRNGRRNNDRRWNNDRNRRWSNDRPGDRRWNHHPDRYNNDRYRRHNNDRDGRYNNDRHRRYNNDRDRDDDRNDDYDDDDR